MYKTKLDSRFRGNDKIKPIKILALFRHFSNKKAYRQPAAGL
jgi:hypothetical protein